MSINLVTGYSGKAHISSVDHGALNTMIFGDDSFVLPFGNQFVASVGQKNTVQADIHIADGDMMMQGRHIRIASGYSETVTIPMPKQGFYRDDLIVIRYTKDATSGIESCEIAVLEGEEDESRLGRPSYTTGDLTDGSCLLHEFPLYLLRLYSGDILSIEPLFAVKNPLSGVNSIPLQFGTATIEYSATRDTSAQVEFPVQFAKLPIVFVSQVFDHANLVVKTASVTTSGFTVNLEAVGSNGHRDFAWLALA